jgi:hypothetical protein
MKLSKNQYFIIFLAVISVILFVAIIQWGDYLANNVLLEPFNPNANEYSHNVDLPINTSYSCQNTCGPASTCSMTGEQCTSDVDCYGCRPKRGVNYSNVPGPNRQPMGDNDAGKLTVGETPQYSSLTSGFGTQEKQLAGMNFPPAMADFGTNVWYSEFVKEDKLFGSKFKPNRNTEFMPHYPRTNSLTGQFTTDGPLPANY